MPRGVPMFQESAALTLGAASSDRIDFGSGAGLDNLSNFTWLAWLYPTTLTSGRRWTFSHKDDAGAENRAQVHSTTTEIRMVINTSGAQANYITSNAAITVNKWWCTAQTYEDVGHTCQIYRGDIVTPVTECTYGTATAGGGNKTADGTKNLLFGNIDTTTLAFQGRVAVVAVFDRVLSVSEIRAWQYSALDDPYPRVMAGCRLLAYPGNEGSAAVLDYSGYNNTGTATGATLSRGVSIPARSSWDVMRGDLVGV